MSEHIFGLAGPGVHDDHAYANGQRKKWSDMALLANN